MRCFAIIPLAFLTILGTSCASQHTQEEMFWKSKEEKFWKWFQANEARLFSFEQDQDRVFADLGPQMSKVHPSLTFEFGPIEDGKREFVISADGNKEAFPAVNALADKAPPLDRWIVVKFRQRRGTVPDIGFESTRVKSSDVQFTIEPDGEKAGITLYIDGYKESQRREFGSIGFLFLDSSLGEYDVETKVGFIEFKPSTEPTKLTKLPLVELPEIFDRFFAAKLN